MSADTHADSPLRSEPQGDRPERRVFARPLPRPAWVVAGLVVGAVAGMIGGGVLVEAAVENRKLLGALFGPTLGSGVILIVLSVLVATIGVPAWLRRRYGTCRVEGDQLVFELPLNPRSADPTVPLGDVRDRVPTRRGILLTAWGPLPRWDGMRRLFPLLIPTADQAEREAALALIDAGRRAEAAEPGLILGEGLPRAVVALQLGLCFGLAAIPTAILAHRVPGEVGPWLPWAWNGSLFLLLPGLVLLKNFWLWRYPLRLHVGEQALLLGVKRIDYADLQVLIRSGSTLHAEGRPAGLLRRPPRLTAWLGDEVDRAFEVIRGHLDRTGAALAVEERPAAWATARRRRQGILGALLVAVGFGLALSVALSDPPIYDRVSLVDAQGVVLDVVYPVTARRPALVSVAATGPSQRGLGLVFGWTRVVLHDVWTQTVADGEGVLVDLAAGQGRVLPHGKPYPIPPGTTLHVSTPAGALTGAVEFPPALLEAVVAAGGQVGFVPSVFDVVEPALAGCDDPLVRDLLDGRRCRRLFDVDDGRRRLVWGADFGEVAFAAVAPVGTPLILVSQSVASPFSLYGGQQVRRNPRSVQDGRFTVLRAGGAKSEHELPAFEALLEATRRVQAGGPVPDPSELR